MRWYIVVVNIVRLLGRFRFEIYLRENREEPLEEFFTVLIIYIGMFVLMINTKIYGGKLVDIKYFRLFDFL